LIVIDASALAAVLFDEPEGPIVIHRAGAALLAAPSLLRYEVANICWKKLRRNPEQTKELLAAHGRLELFKIQQFEVDYQAVVMMAEETGLTAYDAAYVWLARTLGVELVSLDARLLRAAARIRGVP
jgi:predicted nucleic acid-binding protein